MLSRDQKKRAITKVRNACLETDFYSVEGEHGWSQDIERLLSERIESPGAAGIDRILRGEFPPKPEERAAVAIFVAFQCLRGNVSRAGYNQVVDTLTKSTLANTTSEIIREVISKREEREPTAEEITRQKAFLASIDQYNIVPHQNDSIRAMLEMAPDLADSIAERKWFLVDHGEPCLLTSDEPVVRWSDPKNLGPFSHGWVTAEQLWMPLTPRYCLVMTWEAQARERVVYLGSKAGPQTARSINFMIAAYAFRWIFHHPGTDPLNGVALPPRPEPMVIDGPKGRIIPDDW